MIELKLKPSDWRYPEMNRIQTLLCWLLNPQCLFFGSIPNDINDVEKRAMEVTLKEAQREYIDPKAFDKSLEEFNDFMKGIR